MYYFWNLSVIIVLPWILLMSKVTGSCPEGFTFLRETGSCFRYFDRPLTWLAARQACQVFKSDLAKIPSQKVSDIVKELRPNTAPVEYWIGANDFLVENEWRWLTGESLSWSDFADYFSGQPNGNRAQQCVIVDTHISGDWQDRACDDPYPYMCEYMDKEAGKRRSYTSRRVRSEISNVQSLGEYSALSKMECGVLCLAEQKCDMFVFSENQLKWNNCKLLTFSPGDGIVQFSDGEVFERITSA